MFPTDWGSILVLYFKALLCPEQVGGTPEVDDFKKWNHMNFVLISF